MHEPIINSINRRLFVGTQAAALVFADRDRSEDGDYQTIAKIPYDTVELLWNPHWAPNCDEDDSLVETIQKARDKLEKHIGEPYEISACGQTVILGSAIAA